MKRLTQMALTFAITFLASVLLVGSPSAQEADPQGNAGGPAEDPGIEIPFIDRDGDGINDLVQNGWGLRFMERYKKRQQLWDQLNIEIIRGEEGLMVDTDGDGVADISFRDYMKDKMDELIDTDGDGVPDTPLRDYLGNRFKGFDRDGDGLPDDFGREEFRRLVQEMRQWRQEVRERIREGLPPFEDEDGDGVPDGLPDALRARRGRS